MNELELSFEKLDAYIRSTIHDESSLIEAKQLCGSWVNSNRQMEKITIIDQLLELLKRRGLYNQKEYNVFKMFKKIIHDPAFNDIVDRHKVLVQQQVPLNPRNIYGWLIIFVTFGQLNNLIYFFEQTAKNRNITGERDDKPENIKREVPTVSNSPIPADKRNEIFQIISNGISSHEFYTLSRYLQIIDDNEMKDIELKHRNSQTRTMVLLSLYETKSNSLKRLMHVLRLIGRSDLEHKINNL